MKAKIGILLLAGLLITTFFASAQQNVIVEQEKITAPCPLVMDVDVPTWSIGDRWEYQISNVVIDFEEDNQTIDVNLVIDSLPLQVADASGGEYKVTFSTAISGDLYAHIVDNSTVYDVTGELVSSTISGDIYFDDGSLGVKLIDVELKGLMMLNVKENGASLLPFTLPIPATIDLILDMENPYTFLNFPLNTTALWGLPGTNISLDGTIQSIWLNIINFIDDIITVITGEPIIPPEFKDYLPEIDISRVLEEQIGLVMPVEIPEIPTLFACFSTDNISVAGQTYEAYNISIAGGLGLMYYVPEIKNIVRISGEFEDELPFISELEMELISFQVQ